jgi:hypothetical protein
MTKTTKSDEESKFITGAKIHSMALSANGMGTIEVVKPVTFEQNHTPFPPEKETGGAFDVWCETHQRFEWFWMFENYARYETKRLNHELPPGSR